MKITIADNKRHAKIYVDEREYSGVKKIAGKVVNDIFLVTGEKCRLVEGSPKSYEDCDFIVAGTIENNSYIQELEASGRIDLKALRGKREVYIFNVIEDGTLVIAGSDKRGAIYGLFHISELIGVSPWVYFADVMPARKKSIIFDDKINITSKEPSVKYRGFFINDEWPSFGNWTFKHFGGFTSKMYENVFELLLRLKGNYLWPAMWSSSFSLDGPDLANALLADEYGIVMCNSHHEPCLRHSEEWDMVKGDDTIYGTAWNFDKNRDGLINYWRDGLRRNGKFENIITIGMRGERDSEILKGNATLQDNIDYLKDVITAQNKLIKEEVNDDIDKVPRMLALYKEVEEYFYGDENSQGLKDWDGLDGVTLMLCEDNFGNMRKLPDKESRDRKGGWGMYYHFDYHGGPISYEWVNSTYLAKVWEQMTMAYDCGVRDIWIVNVGDIKPQELPLSYFMDLAYDFDKWGSSAPNMTCHYTREWVKSQLGALLSENELEKAYNVVEGYTRLNSIRRPEALSPDTYHPVHYGEADYILGKVSEIELLLSELDYKENPAFYELVYYPASASTNQIRLMIYAGKNKLYASQGKITANRYADLMRECIKKDNELRDGYHIKADGKWNGMMMSEHIGFVHWNDEECRYPIYHYIEPARKPRMIVSSKYSTEYTMGGDWTRRKLVINDIRDYGVDRVTLEIANGSDRAFTYRVECDNPNVSLSQTAGTVITSQELNVTVLDKSVEDIVSLWITTDFSKVNVEIPLLGYRVPNMISIEADEYMEKSDSFILLSPYGKYVAGAKAFPQTDDFPQEWTAPHISYNFVAEKEAEYEVLLYLSPSNPITANNELKLGFRLNNENIMYIDTVPKDYRAGEAGCKEWADGVLDNIHKVPVRVNASKGTNLITIYACSVPIVLERIVIRNIETTAKYGYIGMIPK